MSNEENDDFKLVTYNSRRQRRFHLKTNKSRDTVCDSLYSVDEIVNHVNTAVQKFKESPFHQCLLKDIKRSLDILNFDRVIDVVCYGLGNFSENICSKHQLAALLSIKSFNSSNVYVYDPIFTKNEIESLKKLSLRVIEYNEEGKRIISNHPTLVFMPHCSNQLTNNLLYANWTPLINNCILLGNSWSELECNTTNALLEQSAHYLYKLKSYVTEIKLKNNFQYSNTFSGTSLHFFTKEKLNSVSSEFWSDKPDVVINHRDPEFLCDTDQLIENAE